MTESIIRGAHVKILMDAFGLKLLYRQSFYKFDFLCEKQLIQYYDFK